MDPSLESAIQSQVLQRIPLGELSTEDVQYLSALPLIELFSVYFNWRNRFVSARPRTVHLSKEIIAKDRPEATKLAQKIEVGCDLNPHLSTRVEEVIDLRRGKPGRLGLRPDLDLLLNDWGIYHLHLSDVDRGDGFVVRTGDLLFAAFRRNDAYLLDILGHGGWTNESLVNIAVSNWPDSGLFQHVPNMTLQFPVTEGLRKNLRDSGIFTPVQLPSGVAFGPGLSRGGTSARIEAQIIKFWNSIALDEMRCSHEDILAQIPRALDYNPFSDG